MRIVVTRESIDVLPEPWKTNVDWIRNRFTDVPTVSVTRVNGVIVRISDALGTMEYNCQTRRRHGIITGDLRCE